MKDSKDYYGLAPGKSAILRLVEGINCHCDENFKSDVQNFHCWV